MDFTREPIIETVITPRDGYKIVVRSSKTIGQEEYFVDAVEVVSFGGASFFRSLERPKAFLVPVSDYEVLEVREARVVLKNVGLDRSIKIAGGREGQVKTPKEEKKEERREEELKPGQEAKAFDARVKTENEVRTRRDRRRGRGRRRGEGEENQNNEEAAVFTEKVDSNPPKIDKEAVDVEGERNANPILSSLLTPPPTLIKETLHRYRDNALFQSAFYTKEELEAVAESISPLPPLEQPELGSYEVSTEEEVKIWETKHNEAPVKGSTPEE